MMKILVVDDEPSIRTIVRATLERAGYQVIEAADGASGLQKAGSQRPDLILLDIALPQLSGLEVCRRLKARPDTAAAPVLLLTGLLPSSELQAGYSAGAQGCVTKPFAPSALLEKVNDALRRPAVTVPLAHTF